MSNKSLTFIHFFDSAHQLPDSKTLTTKKCMNLHGHTYKVIVELEAEKLTDGMIVDFSTLKTAIDVLDHKFINDEFNTWDKWRDVPSTAENIAGFLYDVVGYALPEGVRVDSVSVCEGYKGEDRANYVTAY